MARYTGPTAKVARRFGEQIFGFSKAAQRKAYPPGMHGRGRKRKQSEYSIQLAEKQKAKYTYGLLERQFENLFDKAAHKQGITGENLLKFLEGRLDNVVYRLGIAKTRRGARQSVLHKHITVNGSIVNIASYAVKPGDIVAVREKSKNLEAITESLAAKTVKKYNWLDWNSEEFKGTFINYPERSQIPENIQEQLIVELYSK